MIVSYQGRRFRVVECGGGGNCLFYSLAYVFKVAGRLGFREDARSLRERAVEALTTWRDQTPFWFDEEMYEKPTDERIGELVDGGWGDTTSILGVLAGADENENPHGGEGLEIQEGNEVQPKEPDDEDDHGFYYPVQVNVFQLLEGGLDDLTLEEQVIAGAPHIPESEVNILWRDGVHYQALIEIQEGEQEEDSGEDENMPEDVAPLTRTAAVKLSEGEISEEISTLNSDSEVLEIHQLDVGQGEAAILLLKRGGIIAHTIIIDGGKFTLGGHALYLVLKKLKVRKIDLVVVSHFDADHVEGLIHLLKNWKPGRILKLWMPYPIFTSSGQLREGQDEKVNLFGKAILRHRKKAPGLGTVAKTGASLQLLDDRFEIRCLAAGLATGFDVNNSSIALRLSFGNFVFYTAGDLESVEEDRLTFEGGKHLCAMKCGHHGSMGSTSGTFLESHNPSVALISAGKHSYCHPDQKVVSRLCKATSVQAIFLTGCMYNRAGVNPEYQKNFRDNVLRVEQKRKEIAAKSTGERPSKRQKKRLERDEKYSTIQRLLGVVAGDDDHLGSIVIHVDMQDVEGQQHAFHVGYFDSEADDWVWRDFRCSGLLKSSVLLPTESYKDLVTVAQLDTEEGSKYKMRRAEKKPGADRFKLLTKAPGEGRKEKTPLPQQDIEHIHGELSDEEDENEDQSYSDEGDESSEQPPSSAVSTTAPRRSIRLTKSSSSSEDKREDDPSEKSLKRKRDK